ncbi:MAG: hypothetical protein LAT68_10545 [Cyclobacteriaceae bacterium]|nr:hypothetical protein [Cyclobacteriaceae bacterium]MCH8516754.1 hypothetical protein [Cyclobacteriaceae bacterium]
MRFFFVFTLVTFSFSYSVQAQGFEFWIQPLSYQFTTQSADTYNSSWGIGRSIALAYEIQLDERGTHAIVPYASWGNERFRNNGGRLTLSSIRLGSFYRHYLASGTRLSAGLFYQNAYDIAYRTKGNEGIPTNFAINDQQDNLSPHNFGVDINVGKGFVKDGFFVSLGYYHLLTHPVSAILVDRFGENISRENLFRPNGFYLQLEMNLNKF